VISASAAVAVQVSLPSNAVISAVGQTTVVDIDIGTVSDVEALGLSITFSDAIANVLSTMAVQRGPLTTNCDSTVINITEPGRLTITAACATVPINGSGTLFSVIFTGIANGTTPLTFSTFTANGMTLIPNGCLLNEGTPTCEPVNGQLVVGPMQPTSTASATGTVTATGTRTPTVAATGTATRTAPATNTATRGSPLASPTMTPTSTALGFTVDKSRADDGTTYLVLRVGGNLGAGAKQVRVTTVAGAIAGAGACAATGNMSGDPTSAVGGVLPPGMTLHPYGDVKRTFVLTPNDISVLTFDEHFGGRVTLGSGGSALNVCAEGFDCAATINVQTLVGLDSTLGSVPPACIASGLNAGCDGLNLRDSFAFGLSASGTPPICTNSANVTVNTTVCSGPPADGFSLNQGQAIVFVFDHSSLAQSGFAVAVGGFGITTDAAPGLHCPANSVVVAVAESGSQPAPPPPTATLVTTSTPTETFTRGPSATVTATGTATSTQPPTRTRAGAIPVVPSPVSPSGLLLIGGLAVGLLWALRRLARPPV
jgi:hypothetical protein